MAPFKANLINAAILILMGVWAFLASANGSVTILIPVFFGVVFLALTPGLKKENKVIAHIAAVLTLLIILALFMPLRGALGRDDMAAVLRVSCMLAGAIFAMVMYVKSFIDVRKARQNS